MNTLGSIVGRTGIAAVLVPLVLGVSGVAQAQTTQLSGLHDALHLTGTQEDGWRAYVAAISPDPGADARRREASRMLPGLPTPRRVDLINAQVDADAAMVHRQGAAVKAFYASLSPDQQRTFDRQTAQQAGGQPGGRAPSGQPLARPSSNTLPQPR